MVCDRVESKPKNNHIEPISSIFVKAYIMSWLRSDTKLLSLQIYRLVTWLY